MALKTHLSLDRQTYSYHSLSWVSIDKPLSRLSVFTDRIPQRITDNLPQAKHHFFVFSVKKKV
jgi:hypothetical protein